MTKEQKEVAIELLRNQHRKYFDHIGVSLFSYYPKIIFRFGTQNTLALFPSEFAKVGGFYTEVVSFEFQPVQPRKLLRMPNTPDFKERFPCVDPPGGMERYAVPLEAFEVIDVSSVFLALEREEQRKEQAQEAAKAPVQVMGGEGDLPDMPYDQMSVRDHMALMTWRPLSNKEWINDIIRTTKKSK